MRAKRPSRWPSGCGRGTSGTTRTAANALRGATCGACAGRSDPEPGSERCPIPSSGRRSTRAARVFVSAGAGTGKTTVLVERFARAVVDDGLDVESLLVITYTDRAAGELRSRIRARLLELDRPDLARELDGAWISTIHGFCRRLLTAHPVAAGIDPRFRVLDDAQSRVIQGEAFAAALEAFCATDDDDRWQLLATYGAEGLRSMLVSVYDTLRSAGRELVLEPGCRASLDDSLSELREAAELSRRRRERDRASACGCRARRSTSSRRRRCPNSSSTSTSYAARGPRAATYNDARSHCPHGRTRGARGRATVRCSRSCSVVSRMRTRRQGSRVGARLRGSPAARPRPAARAPGDPRVRAAALPVDHGGRVPGHEPAADRDRSTCCRAGPEKELFFVGDEFQSIYGFRHADVAVFRERRASAPQRVAADPQLPVASGGARGRQRAVRRRVRRRLPAARAGRRLRRPVCWLTPFELLVTDKASYADTGVHWRRAEARHVARRVRELVDLGAATPGEIVLLFAAGTDAEWFEEELRAVDLPTYRMTGRRYFGQQQVVDLLSYLRLLQNRYDDEALLTVLGVAVRRCLERRARPDPCRRGETADLQGHRAQPAGRSRGRRQAPRAGFPAAL